MVDCNLINLGSCLPQQFFQFLLDLINAPIVPFLNTTVNLLSAEVNLEAFFSLWVIIVYMLSMFYALLLVGTGFSFMFSGADVVKRENSKQWLRNIVVMIILVQASFFLYQLIIDMSAAMTSATLTLLDPSFFSIDVGDVSDLGLALIFAVIYLLTLIITSLVLVCRYAVVAVGVVLFPLAIFFYFLNPLKQYGVFLFNFLGIAIFITFFDAILLIGFSQLSDLPVLNNIRIIVLVSAFLLTNVFTIILMSFSVVKAALSAYSQIKKLGIG